MYFGNAETRKHTTWAFIVKSSCCLSEHCCINVFRMSWVRVRFSGTMAWLTHACTLPPFVSLFLSLSNTHTHSTDSTHLSFLLYFIHFLCQRGCFPNHHVSTVHCTRHLFNITLLQVIYLRQLEAVSELCGAFSSWCLTDLRKRFASQLHNLYKWGKFHQLWVVLIPPLTCSNHEYLMQVL